MILFQIIYLFIFNNIKQMFNINYLKMYVKDIIFLLSTTTIPYYLFEYISNISNINFINNICYQIYFYLYFIPSNIIIYVCHINKLNNLLEIENKPLKNPNNIYLSFFNILLYGLLFLLNKINIYVKLIYYIIDSFGFSIYLSDISYNYIDTQKLNYSNKIDFYNNNKFFFSCLGILCSVIISNCSSRYFILTSYIVIAAVQNILIDFNYNKYSYKNSKIINVFILFEYLFNYILFFIINIILTMLMIREPITSWI